MGYYDTLVEEAKDLSEDSLKQTVNFIRFLKTTENAEPMFSFAAEVNSAKGSKNLLSSGFAFENIHSHERVVIAETVTDVADWAFSGCSNLENMTIPDGVTRIGFGAFENCSGLKNVVIPDGVADIATSAFENCSSLESLTLPESVMHIGNEAFCGCGSLASLTIHEGLVSIGENAFYGCIFKSVTIPKSVVSIGENAFGYIWSKEAWHSVLLEGFTIKCYEGSVAEAYAKKHNIPCNLLKQGK